MPSLIDIFNPSFFMFLGILVLVAALLVVYFESKMREQNHKMASMLSLITCIAEEMNDIKSQPRVGGFNTNQSSNSNSNSNSNINSNINSYLETTNINNTHIIKTDLIHVSDDSDNDNDSNNSDSNNSDSDSDSESDNDSESNSEPDNDFEEVGDNKEVIELGEHPDIKVFKLNISSMNNIDENKEDFKDLDDLDDLCDLEDDHFSDDSVSVDSNEDNEEQKDDEINILDLNLKSINISNLEEVKTSNNIDYKKFTLSKLRSTVVEKGLVQDSSKLKKNDLLKLLGCSNE